MLGIGNNNFGLMPFGQPRRLADETDFSSAMSSQGVGNQGGNFGAVAPQVMNLVPGPLTGPGQVGLTSMNPTPISGQSFGMNGFGMNGFNLMPLMSAMFETIQALSNLVGQLQMLMSSPGMTSSPNDGNPVGQQPPQYDSGTGSGEGDMTTMPVGDHGANVSDPGYTEQAPPAYTEQTPPAQAEQTPPAGVDESSPATEAPPAPQGVRSASDDWYLNGQGELSERQINNINAVITGQGDIELTTMPPENQSDFVGGHYPFNEVADNLNAVAHAPHALGRDVMWTLGSMDAPANVTAATQELFSLQGADFKNAFLDLMRTPLGEVLAPALERAVMGLDKGEEHVNEAPAEYAQPPVEHGQAPAENGEAPAEYDNGDDVSDDYDAAEYDNAEYESTESDAVEYESAEYESTESDAAEYDNAEYESTESNEDEYESAEYESTEYESAEYDNVPDEVTEPENSVIADIADPARERQLGDFLPQSIVITETWERRIEITNFDQRAA